jgi:hypothetical protein
VIEEIPVSKLSDFFLSSERIEVHENTRHVDPDRPSYTRKFLKALVAVGLIVASAKSGLIERAYDTFVLPQESRQVISVAKQAAYEGEVGESDISEVSRLARKYIDHGITPGPRTIAVLPNEQPHEDVTPSTLPRSAACLIFDVRTDYVTANKGSPDLNDAQNAMRLRNLGDPMVRAAILIHEDAHCRINPFLPTKPSLTVEDATPGVLEKLFKGRSEQHSADVLFRATARSVFANVGENVADTMMLMMIAHKDGVDAALKVAGVFMSDYRVVRNEQGERTKANIPASEWSAGLESRTVDSHDTYDSIERAVAHLLNEGAPRNPREAWRLAVEIGTEGGIESGLAQFRARNVLGYPNDRIEAFISEIRAGAKNAVLGYDNPAVRPSRLDAAVVTLVQAVGAEEPVASYSDSRMLIGKQGLEQHETKTPREESHRAPKRESQPSSKSIGEARPIPKSRPKDLQQAPVEVPSSLIKLLSTEVESPKSGLARTRRASR